MTILSAKIVARFHRITPRTDEMSAALTNGSNVVWRCPTYGGGLPHDLVHAVVEPAFGLVHALWGRVARGIDPSVANARRAWARDAEHAELLVAEGLAAVHWFDPLESGASQCASIAESCRSFGVEPPASTTDADRAELVIEVLRRLRARWRESGSEDGRAVMELELAPTEPEASFARIARGEAITIRDTR
ncbi:MAG: hypothetical protein U0271_02630 [Polyangiaceae bacterium]